MTLETSRALPTSRPAAQGLDAQGVLAFVEALEAGGFDPHSVAIARHGQVVAQGWWAPYRPDRVQLLYSLSKSFTATAVGFLVDEGRLRLDDLVFEHLAGQLPPGSVVDDRYGRLTVGQCLTMATGHLTDAWTGELDTACGVPADATGPDPVLAAVLASPPQREPGSVFAYNQVATYLAGSVVRAVSGTSLLAYLRPRLLDPLAMGEVLWHHTATGRELGFSGVHATTGAVLALAQLYLDEGRLQGSRLLSADWVRTARTPTGLPNHDEGAQRDWRLGYGCSFWTSRHGYRGDGAFGQFALVLPEHDVAVAVTGETTDMQGVLDLVWEHLVPACDRPGSGAADAELEARLATLSHPALASTGTISRGGTWRRSPSSQLPPAYGSLTWSSTGSGHDLLLDHDGTRVDIPVGDGSWAESTVALGDRVLPVAASGGWTADGRFRADLRIIETPHTVTVRTDHDGTVDLGWRVLPLMGPDPWHLTVRSHP